eukprot:6317618-Pyramimonas_sp.AAC.1
MEHICYKCGAANKWLLEGEVAHPMPEELSQLRDSILLNGTINRPVVTDECFGLSVGLPQIPGGWEYAGLNPPVRFWGCWEGSSDEWPRAVFTDGSAIPPSIPELRRCGWACVQVPPDGYPVRA